ncbi:MAG: hypothetical protein M3144_12790 [Actinomycetota bacterium]|nr:hypothetical protein [Actinomycetota bacterium]
MRVEDETEVGSRLSIVTRRLLKRGRAAIGALPTVADLKAMADDKRHRVLEGLRLELYAISSILADGVVERAYRDRPEHPPYGLVRSGHTDWKLVLASPKTVEEGAIDGFYALGKAYVDTMVFHLTRHLGELAESDEEWMVNRLEELLALFRVGAGAATQARMRDGLSFVYGGLHFGTGVSVQLAEVMVRLLEDYPGLTAGDRAEIMTRSSRPALRLAALNLDHVIVAYHEFLEPPQYPSGPQWFDPDRFVVRESDGRPRVIDFDPEDLVAGKPHTPKAETVQPTYETHGCRARISPTGASPPITRLWTWCVELARATGLLGEEAGPSGSG